MQDRENSHMKALAEEWKRRDKERELMVKKKVEQKPHFVNLEICFCV